MERFPKKKVYFPFKTKTLPTFLIPIYCIPNNKCMTSKWAFSCFQFNSVKHN